MLLGAMSFDCFHCVDYRAVNSSSEMSEYLGGILGMTCPLCGVRVKKFRFVTDTEDLKELRDGTGLWNKPAVPSPGFQRFRDVSHSPSDGFSVVAEKLRRELSAGHEKQRKAILWSVTEVVQADFALTVGLEARQAKDVAAAREAFHVCARTGKPVAARAAFFLGQLDEQEGKTKTAASWYQKATKSADTDFKALAYLHLGIVLHRGDDLPGASQAYRRCVDCGIAPMRGMAAYRLGTVLYDQRKLPEARDAYEFAVGLNDPHGSPEAALNLGALEEDDGNYVRATTLAEYAFQHGDESTRALAAFNLARSWEYRRRPGKARKYYKIAQNSDNPDIADRARAALRFQ